MSVDRQAEEWRPFGAEHAREYDRQMQMLGVGYDMMHDMASALLGSAPLRRPSRAEERAA